MFVSVVAVALFYCFLLKGVWKAFAWTPMSFISLAMHLSKLLGETCVLLFMSLIPRPFEM